MSRTKSWVITLQNSQFAGFIPFGKERVTDVNAFRLNKDWVPPDSVNVVYMQLEEATSRHLQMYIEFSEPGISRAALLAFQTIFGDASNHFTAFSAKGSRTENKSYCTKNDTRVGGGSPLEEVQFVYERPGFDLTSSNGSKSDRDKLPKARELMTTMVFELVEKNQEIITLFDLLQHIREKLPDVINPKDPIVRRTQLVNHVGDRQRFFTEYISSFGQYRQTLDAKNGIIKIRKMYVEVLVGTPGSGKTTSVYLKYGGYGIYKKDRSEKWWDAYNPTIHKVLLLDDFLGENPKIQGAWLTPSFLQDLLQGMPLSLSRRGMAPIEAGFKYVFITSNLPFDSWFGGWSGIDMQIKQSIRDRISNLDETTYNTGVSHRNAQNNEAPPLKQCRLEAQ